MGILNTAQDRSIWWMPTVSQKFLLRKYGVEQYFFFFRTLGTNNFKEVHFVDEPFIDENIQPYKEYDRKVENKPNIVIFIVESFSREYSGAFNKDKNIKDYVSYTPFIDSLAGQSLIFPILLPTEDSQFMG